MSEKKSAMSRRDFLAGSLAAAGSIGFRSMLLGLPSAFLSQRAMAAGNATYLVYSCYSEGCPLNANVPGSYIPGITHPGSFANPTTFTLGSSTVQAAAPWANLSVDLRNRMQFIHHDTQTNSHSEAENVLKGQGAIKSSTGSGQEMLPSAIAQMNQAALGTMATAPIVLGNISSNFTFDSVPQPLLAPGSIASIFPTPNASTSSLQRFRDQAVDGLYKDLRSNGTPAQRKYMDDHVLSSTQSRSLATEFQSTLSGLGASPQRDQLIAAAALIAAKVTPSIIVRLRFGGDNHSESGTEEAETIASCSDIQFFYDRLTSMGLASQTTFCIQNVFGRSLVGDTQLPVGGRGHHGGHSVAVMFGPNVKAGVTGSVKMTSSFNGFSQPINSTTGTSTNADIPTTETLASTAKTLMKACGIDETRIDQRVTLGKILRSAVV